jgi:DNA-binding transcriptional ArsR family regulator
MTDELAVDTLNLAFAALADPTRRDLVARLSLGDATVNELAAPYGNQSAGDVDSSSYLPDLTLAFGRSGDTVLPDSLHAWR